MAQECPGLKRYVRRREDAMTAKGIFYVFASVSDLARSKKFYGETLGWTLGTDEADVAGFSVGSGYLVIHADDRQGEARRYAGGRHVAIQLDDVDAEHARLRELGVTVSELRDQPWGERNFSFDDPDGYVWWYGQPRR
jgi:catechol 2,3-dioxygenase-like lactoylglutathione lyase family enzyme